MDLQPTTTTEKSYEYVSLVIPFNAKTTSYVDLTGRFPYKSTSGNEYLYILYDFDSNAIFALPIKNRQAKTLTTAWETLYQRLTNTGHKTKHFILDNEISGELKKAFNKYNVSFELTPPHMHRRNAAERAIRTYKNHLLAGLATCHPEFPLTEWDRLIEQCNITINLLRTSRINPNLSAYTYIHGNYDFNAHPLAPPGTKVVLHKKPDNRASWQYHGVEAWYVGPSLDHYRCFKCFVPSTGTVIDTDTVQLIPHLTPIPAFNDADAIKQAISDIIYLLKHSKETNIPKFWKGDHIQRAFEKVAEALDRRNVTAAPTLIPSDEIQTFNIKKSTNPISKNSTKPISKTHLPIIPPDPPTLIPAPPPRVESRKLQTYNMKQNLVQKDPARPSPRVVSPLTPPQRVTWSNPLVISRTPSPISKKSANPISALSHISRPVHGTNRFPKIRTPAPTHIWKPKLVANHIFNDKGKKQSIDNLIIGPMKTTWLRSTANELGRIANGIPDRVRGTDCIEFIPKSKVPKGKKVTYANMVCDYRPLKDEPYRVRLTVGGDKLDYFGETASPTANLLETKLLINSVISDAHKGARFLGIDIKDFFLLSSLPADQREYMRIHSKYFDEEFRKLYNITPLIANDGYVYCEIQKGMYGLKQAAILAFEQLGERLNRHGYYQICNSNGLWHHETRPTIFALCVDDFAVKYFSEDDANHLIESLKIYYPISLDREGKNYCGLTLHWNYKEGYVDVDMPQYVSKKLQNYQHSAPEKPQHAPHKWNQPAYGQKTQFAPEPDKTSDLNEKDKKLVQSIVGAFLYYGRAIDPSILPALNEISTQQSKPTKKTLDKTKMLMDYMSTYPNARMRYVAGTMQLMVDSDAAYLVLPGAKSRIAGHYMLASKSNIHNEHKSPHNAPIHVECKTIKNVVCSAAEAETAGLFYNGQMAAMIRGILNEMGHQQRPTKLKTDNSTANSFVHATMHMKRSKTWDMRYHWLRERKTRKQLDIYWDKGINNHADYFTKHHPPTHHKTQRQQYILKGYNMTSVMHNNFWARVYSTTMSTLHTYLGSQKRNSYIRPLHDW